MTHAASTAERIEIKISSEDFRVRKGDEVDLRKWPTNVGAVFKFKEQYQKLLVEYVGNLSSLKQLLYTSNRFGVLLIFQAIIKHVMSRTASGPAPSG